MRRLLIVVLALCGSAFGQDQLPVPVQVCPSAASATCAFTNNVTSGNIEFVSAHSEGALTTPTGTQTGTFTLVDSHVGGANVYLWCRILTSTGSETITLTGSLSFAGQVDVEFPNPFGWTCTKDSSANGATVSGTVTTSSITTAQNGDLMLCAMSNIHSGSWPVPHEGGSFLSVFTENGSDSMGLGYQFAGTNGSYNCVFDGGSDTNAGYVIAAFKPSGAFTVTTALPSGSLTHTYSYTPQCVGGVGAYTWSASSLPTGLSINSSTGAITGTPTGGTTTPTITCTGATSGTASLSSAPLTINSSVGTMSIVSSVGIAQSVASGSLGTVTSGNCIAASISVGRFPVSPPTDSLSTNFKYIGTHAATGVNATSTIELTFWLGIATSTGTDTFTSISGHAGALVVQIANCQTFIDVASSNAGQNAGSVTLSGNALTTLAPGSEIWSTVIGWSAGTTWTAGSGFAADVNVSSQPMQGIDATETSVGTYTPSFVQSGNADGHWVIWGIALRPSTSGVVIVSNGFPVVY